MPSCPGHCFFIDSPPLLSAHHHCCSSESCHRSPKHYRNAFSAGLVISTWLHTASLETLVFKIKKKANLIFLRRLQRLPVAFKEKSSRGAGNMSMSTYLIPASICCHMAHKPSVPVMQATVPSVHMTAPSPLLDTWSIPCTDYAFCLEVPLLLQTGVLLFWGTCCVSLCNGYLSRSSLCCRVCVYLRLMTCCCDCHCLVSISQTMESLK